MNNQNDLNTENSTLGSDPASSPLISPTQTSTISSHTHKEIYKGSYKGTQKFAKYVGGFMLLTAVAALLVPGPVEGLLPLNLEVSHGMFMNMLPMNIVNKLALLTFGVAGILTSQKLSSSVAWTWATFIAMTPLTIMGIFPATNTLFGYADLYFTQIPTYGLFGILGLVFALMGSKHLTSARLRS